MALVIWQKIKNFTTFLDIYPHFFWEYDAFLYDCSNRTIAEWIARGEQKPLQGCLAIVFGVIAILLYFVTLTAMAGCKTMKHSCYKMMYFTSIYNIVNIFNSNIVSGYFLVIGATFCTHPVSNFALGAVAMGGWMGMCFAVIFLALGRLVEVIDIGRTAFRGRRVFIWMLVPICVSCFFMFLTRPPLFNSKQGVWILIPFIDDDVSKEMQLFGNHLYLGVGIFTPVIITGIYCILLIYIMICKARSKKALFTKNEWNMLTQCSIICSSLTLTCYLYEAVMLLNPPDIVKSMAQVSYQITECAPLVAYLFYNTGVRKRIVEIVHRYTSTVSVHDVSIYT